MNNINSRNKQGPQKVYRDYFKELYINNIDVIKALKLIKNVNDTNNAIDNLEEVLEFLKNIQDNENLKELIENIKPIDISKYINTTNPMPLASSYSYGKIPISHYRVVNTGDNEYDIVFCSIHLDTKENNHEFIIFSSNTDDTLIYQDTYSDNPDDDNYAPLYIRALFNSALTGETNGTTTIEKGLMSIKDKEKLDNLDIYKENTYDFTDSSLYIKNEDESLSPIYSDINNTVGFNKVNCVKTTDILEGLAFQEITRFQLHAGRLCNMTSGDRILGFTQTKIHYVITITGIYINTITSISSNFKILEQTSNKLVLKVTDQNHPYIYIPRYRLSSAQIESITIQSTISLNNLNDKLNTLNSRIKSIEDKSEEYVHLFEVYADEQCTRRPIAGESYKTLYVQINGSTPYVMYYNNDSIDNVLYAFGPTQVYPTSDYDITVYIDYLGKIENQYYEENGESIIGGKLVIKCDITTDIPVIFQDYWDVSFGPLIKINK